jgi:inhibitor of cysteine peptidase
MLFIVFGFSGCSQGSEIRITAERMGESVEVKQGDVLVIELPANPSTGYAWEVKDLDATILEIVGEPEFIQSKSGEEIVGAVETQIIRLKAIGKGETRLELIYHRSFEPDVEPLESHFLDLSIK